MKDWKQIAIRQDKLLYDHNAKGKFLPLIWWDDTKVNFPIRSFGLPSYVGSLRNMEKGNHYESLPTIGSLVGASLIGIDKSNYEGYDYVTMVRQLYNRSIGYNLVLNSVGRRAGETFWYDIFPTMAFTMLVDLYPNKPDMAEVMMGCADTWNGAVTDMKGNAAFPDFNYTGFDFKSRKGMYNKRWREPDAAAGVAWLQYAAWKKFGGDKYLDAAKSSMEFLQQRPARDGVFYEILMPYGACLAVRMNAEMGTNYDELKMLNWCFDGNNSDRDGWGVMCEKWGEYDVHGLVGQKKWEQYAFAMNTFSQAAALVPIVKYNPAYSQTIGKWILNLANASRLFYADEHPRNRQTSAIWNGDPDHVICYEGVRKNLTNGNHFESLQGVLADKGPYALGDQVKTLSSFTDICPYGSAWVGMLASIVDTTNVEKILKLNCNATDFFGDRSFPTFLLFNPFYEPRTVQLEVGKNSVNVYDLVSKQYLKKNVSGTVDLPLNENSAVTLVLIPANVKTSIKGNRLMAGNSVIDYRYK
ncbi:MAG: hypothetical protein M1445_17205 [Bacteroidetes bacterium]|nr:hypothetical protein [Bacteroidota bacterium]